MTDRIKIEDLSWQLVCHMSTNNYYELIDW